MIFINNTSFLFKSTLYFHHHFSYSRYLDQNNLYGNAQCCFLPTKNFRWIKEKKLVIDNWKNWKVNSKTGYILDVDLEYPAHLHKKHRENPLAPETTVINFEDLSPTSRRLLQENDIGRKSYTATKMVTSFAPRRNYVVHYMNLQL